jgi:hypothetical protein
MMCMSYHRSGQSVRLYLRNNCESSSCYLSIAAEAFANPNSTHLKVIAERGLEAYCTIVSSIILAVSPESTIKIRMWGEDTCRLLQLSRGTNV